MEAFTIDCIPNTFAAILQMGDEQEREETIDIVHSVWDIATYRPLVLSNIGLRTWASDASYGSQEQVYVILRILRDEMLENANTAEQYYAALEDSSDSDFQEFLETIDIRAICETCIIETYDSNKILESALWEVKVQYKKYFGRTFYADEEDDVFVLISDIVDDLINQQNNIFIVEENTMTANYKNVLNQKDKAIEAITIALTNQEVRDEFENILYAEVAKNPDVLTEEGQKTFTREWVKKAAEGEPNLQPAVGDESLVDFIIENLTAPISKKIKDAAEKMSKEEFSETFDTKESDIKNPEDIHKEETKMKEKKSFKPFKFMFKVCNKTKEGILKALKAIKTFFCTIGRAIKKAAIATGHAVQWVASKINDNFILSTFTDLFVGIGTGLLFGKGTLALISKLGIVYGSWKWVVLAGAGSILAGAVAMLLDWLFHKIVNFLDAKRKERIGDDTEEYETIGRNVFEGAFEEEEAEAE